MKEDNFIISDDTRVIAKYNDFYIITNSKETVTPKTIGIVVDKNGRFLSLPMSIASFFTRNAYQNYEFCEMRFCDVNSNYKKNIVQETLIGFAVGDAFGTAVEFMPRETIRNLNLNDMLGCDTHRKFDGYWSKVIPAGAWSDDTSMIIATMDAFNSAGKFDYKCIMDNFVNWWNKGKYSSLDFPFGLGKTVGKALDRYLKGTTPTQCGGVEYMDNGNGSLMRILPFSLYCIENNLNIDDTVKLISEASSLTHGNDISKMSCVVYTEFLKECIRTKNVANALNHIIRIGYKKYFDNKVIKEFDRVLSYDIISLKDSEINQSGYVVDTLKSVLYSVLKGKNYEETVKIAVNLGYDTDTVAGITGSIAGVLYGVEDIPERWTNMLKRKTYLEEIADKFQQTLINTKVSDKTEKFLMEEKKL